MVNEFENRNYWALVLGGSSGLGLATAKKLAEKLGFKYLDSGSMYRALGMYLSGKGIDTEQVKREQVQGIDIDFTSENFVRINGEDYE